MKIRILTIVAFLVMAITPAKAQIYLGDDDWGNGRDPVDPAVGALIPEQDVIYDQYYAPVGEGLVLLAGFGFAYLLGKRRKNDNQ